MKNAAMIIVSAIMGFLVLGIVLTIGGSMNRRCEAETILPSAMEKTIEGMTLAEEDCSSGELVLAECVELLAAEIDTDSDVPIVQANISLYKFTSCQASDPRLKLLQMKWFFHVIIGSCIQPFHFIRYLASRRQNQHLCLLILPPEFP